MSQNLADEPVIREHGKRISILEDVVKGDGERAGLGYLVTEHEEALKDKDGVVQTLVRDVRSLKDDRIKLAAWVAGAVGTVLCIFNYLKPILPVITKHTP